MALGPRSLARLTPDFSLEKAYTIQRRLSKKIIYQDQLPEIVKHIAGVDVAYSRDVSIGVAVVLDFASLSIVETQCAIVKTRFPYIKTLLAFREVPPAFSAIRKLRVSPDVFLVDGHGVAHPNRLGFASQLGLLVSKATIGVAKNLLCGEVGSFNERMWAPVVDYGSKIGAAVVRIEGEKPIFVSVGNRISLNKAIRVVMHSTGNCRIPEPIRKAHILANAERRKLERTCA